MSGECGNSGGERALGDEGKDEGKDEVEGGSLFVFAVVFALICPGRQGHLASFAESVQCSGVQCSGDHRRSDSGRCFSSDFSSSLSMRMHSLYRLRYEP